MLKKYLSLIICICVTLSCVTLTTTTVSAADEVIISDYFTNKDYAAYDSNNQVINYASNVTNPGTGWDGKWLSDLNGTEIGENEKGIVYTYLTGGAVNNTGYRTLRSGTYNGTVYRKFASPISLTQDGEYTVKFKFSDGISSAANRKNQGFRFYIGSSFSVGYKWDTLEGVDPTQTKSFLTVGEETVESSVAQDTAANWNAAFKEIIAYVVIDADGTDTIKVKMVDEGTTSNTWDIEKNVELTGEISYFGFTALKPESYSSVRIGDIEITKIDTERKAVADQVRAEMPGYNAVTLIDSITDEALRSELIAEYNAYGFAYDQMNNARYADLFTEYNGKEKYDDYGIQWGTGGLTVDGGAGWNGGWTHERYKGAAEKIYPNAYIIAKGGKYTNISEITDYAMLLQSYSSTYKDGYDLISRTLNTPIDLSVEGEYFVKLTGTWNQWYAEPETQVEVSLGNAVAFGSGCTSTAQNGAANAYTPMIKTGNGEYNESSAVTIPRREYYDYIIRIVSHEAEPDSYEMYVCDKDSFSSSTEAVYTGTFESAEEIDTVSIKVTCGQFAIYSVAVESFNDSITGNPFKLDTVRANIGAAGSMEGAQAVADALPTCVAAEYLQANALEYLEYLDVDFFQFDKGKMAEKITTLDDYYNAALETNKVRAVLAIKNNYKTKKDINVFFAVYDGNDLVAVKRSGYNIEAGKRYPQDTSKYIYTYLNSDCYIPAGLTNPVVKVMIWDYNSMKPYVFKTIQKTFVDPAES